ncbi:unnamed protein product, partial [Discosporangium mesarthrocarpum]
LSLSPPPPQTVWDVRNGRCTHTLAGHHGEISSTQFNFSSDLCISGSIDRTCKVEGNRETEKMKKMKLRAPERLCFLSPSILPASLVPKKKKKIWDVGSGQCIHTLRGHNDEILDVSFNATGSKLVTASADGTSRVFNTINGACQAILMGHDGEISKAPFAFHISQVCFNPQGTRILTASSDKTARLWEVEVGDCLQVLEGHTDEIFSCAFNYEGDTIITGKG